MNTDGDHCKAANEIIKYAVDIYGSYGTIKKLGLVGHRVHIIEANQVFDLGTFKIIPFDIIHDAVQPFGFYMADAEDSRLLYVSDSHYIQNTFGRINYLMIECNYTEELISPDINPSVRKRLYHSHMSLESVKRFLSSTDLSKCREIHLIHISRGNGDSEYFKKEIEALTGIPTYTI